MIHREFGETLAISVGTALAFEESILKEGNKIKILWMNIATLFRNFKGSFEGEVEPTVEHWGPLFISELNEIYSFLTTQGIEPCFYVTAHTSHLKKTCPLANVKEAETKPQIQADNELRVALRMVENNFPPNLLKHFKFKLYGELNREVYIMTHLPLDLVSQYEFGYLKSLESHTGEIKEPVNWITKLSKNDNYRHLPLNILTIQLFGDGSKQFKSMSIKIKRELLSISEQGKWVPTTSLSKVKGDIERYGKEFKSELLQLASVKLP